MLKKERKLYKSGENNPNAYKFHILTHKERRKVIMISVLSVIAIIISILEIFGVTNWNKVNLFTGAVDGIKISENDFVVYYLDVGQSDCSIIVSNDEVMVIDSGSYPRLRDIQETLYSLNVDKIDYLVITHQHDDHISGAERLIDIYNVKNVIMPKVSEAFLLENETFEQLLHIIADKNINAISAKYGDEFKLGEAKVNILAPLKQYKELNNMSVVMKVTYGETSFLFQGDAESQVENDLLCSDYNLNADVLKLGHHGSKTASTEKYLDKVNPKISIISCGTDNPYGHPRVTIMNYLIERNIDYFITSECGDITVSSDGKTITVQTQNSNNPIIY